MITTENIQLLKQTNISVNADKTKERVRQLWKAARNEVKRDVLSLAGCSKPTVYRIYDTGSINIKLAIAIGKTLNINPYYLTGEVDDLGEFTDILLLQILEQHGYKMFLSEFALTPTKEKPKRKYTRRAKDVIVEAAISPKPEAEAVEEIALESEADPVPAVVEPASAAAADIDFSEEDIHALIHSLMILSRAGIAGAVDKLARIKAILIS